MPQTLILNVRKDVPGFLPMEEAFLAQALRALDPGDIEIRSVMSEEIEACAEDVARLPGDARVVIWENASYKSCQSLLDYFRLADEIRRRSDVRLAAGGYWASSLAPHYPERFRSFDMVVPGFNFAKAAEALTGSLPEDNKVVDATGPCDWNAYDLDLSPLTTPDRYVGLGYISGYRTTFGCPKNCHFCYNNMLRDQGARYSERDVAKVRADVEHIVSRYGNVPLQIKDRNFFCNRSRAFEIMDMLRDMDVQIASNLDVTVNDADEEIFRKCREVGVTSMFFGLESFNPDSLRRFNKPYPVEKLEHLFALADQYEITLSGCLLLGLPWQTMETIRGDVQKAFAYMDRFKFLRINLNNYHPLPETALQRDYFPTTTERLSLEDLNEIFNFRMNERLQTELYGPRFADMNFEKLRAHALALNSISLLEHYHIPRSLHWIFWPVKRLVRGNITHSAENNFLNRLLTKDRIVSARRRITRVSIRIKKLLGAH